MVNTDVMDTREVIRQKYVAHRSADIVEHEAQKAIALYELEYENLDSEGRTQESKRLYEQGIAIGEVLFKKASPVVPQETSSGLAIPYEARVLSLPALGNFLITLEGVESGEAACMVQTYTNTGLVTGENEYVTQIGPDWRDAVAVQSGAGLTILARMRYNFDRLEVLSKEAGVSAKPVELVK